jgi:hypothetical protein
MVFVRRKRNKNALKEDNFLLMAEDAAYEVK